MTNRIHATAIIEGDVDLGSGNVVMPYAVVVGPCTIGDDNWIGPHSTIGTPAQHREGEHPAWDASQGGAGVEIGSGNRIREFVTIHQGSVQPTRVHNDCYLMAYSHVPHDAEYEDGVTMANATQVGGHTWIGRGATIGLAVSIRQRLFIGAYAMVGMSSAVTANIPPMSLAYGSPARVAGANRVGLGRNELADPDEIERIDNHYRTAPSGPPDFLSGGLKELVDQFNAAVDSG